MITSQLNTLCAAYANVDKISLHTDSGTDASDMIGSKEDITWGSPSSGVMTGTASFSSVTALVRYIRVWDDDTFIEEFPVNGGEGTDVVAQDVTVAIQHRVSA